MFSLSSGSTTQSTSGDWLKLPDQGITYVPQTNFAMILHSQLSRKLLPGPWTQLPPWAAS